MLRKGYVAQRWNPAGGSVGPERVIFTCSVQALALHKVCFILPLNTLAENFTHHSEKICCDSYTRRYHSTQHTSWTATSKTKAKKHSPRPY